METLEALRRQIDNVQDMQSVVATMKTLAAVSIRQYEAAADALSVYDRTVDLGFHILLRQRPLQSADDGGEVAACGAIVFGSDQGMCGQFNDQIAEHSMSEMRRVGPPSQWSILAVGARLRNRLDDAGWPVDELYSVPVSVDDITRLVQELLPRIEQWRAEKRIDRLSVFFNEHQSASAFQPRQRRLLPLAPDQLRQWQQKRWESNSLPTHTLAWRELFSAVLREYLFVSLYRACAESLASENASRIASMQAAEKNINERLSDLEMQYHQRRQSSITEELLDVVTGFEALSQQEDES